MEVAIGMGGAILSAVLPVLFHKLASKQVVDFENKELKKLEKALRTINAFLNDAETKQYTNEAVKEWLDEFRDLAYDAEDVLDEVATEEALRKNSSSSSTWGRIWRQSRLKQFQIRRPRRRRQIESSIKSITERFDELEQDGLKLGLVKIAFESSSISSSVSRETTSLVNESFIYGRNDDERRIIDLLLKEESSSTSRHNNNKFSVIPIVGMGGVGKTTLAQLVYNSDWVQNHYDLKAWVCVSDKFDVKKITKAILESLTSSTCQVNDLDPLQVKVKESLNGNKFLIILDDVWNKKHGDWDLLQKPFGVGAAGSAIILTTRDRQVALNMGTVNPYDLALLSEDDCWRLFVHHAFGILSVDARPDLAIIGKEIARKCKGLPLAAKSLGGLLRSKEDFEWENVLNSKIWDLPEEESDILPILKLSYYYLPSHLKRCFTYCSIFPKDYEFQEKTVVLLWMAEGFLQSPNENMTLEDFGRKCFRELLSMSFFQPSSSFNWNSYFEMHDLAGNIALWTAGKTFVMHDLMSDLALWAAGKTCFRVDDSWDKRSQSVKARHLSCIISKDIELQNFEELYRVKFLRTFLQIMCRIESLDLLSKMKFLRVLSLPGSDITELPSSIGDLKHLRYIDISYTKIQSIPKSVCNLYNLQTLLLKRCRELTKLPEELEKLINLRHFDISETSIQSIPESVCTLYNLQTLLLNGCSKLTKLPKELKNLINLRQLDIATYACLDCVEAMLLQTGRLTGLRKLSNFKMGKDSECRIEDLANLKHLEGTLRISKLENVIHAEQAKAANLSDKKGLDVLKIEWCSQFDNLRNERVENDVLHKLRPHEKLKELRIIWYGGLSFPTWVGEATFSSMVVIELNGCEKCTHLPPLGQLPLLKDLFVRRMKGVVTVGPEFYGKGSSNPFPSLEKLSFVDMKEWRDWLPCDVEMHDNLFAFLRELTLKDCPNLLGSLPDHLPSLERFEVKGCKVLQSVTEAILGHNCNNSSLELLDIGSCDSLTSIARASSLLFSRVKELKIESCRSLQCLMEEDVEGSSSYKSLCSEMMMMPDNNSRAFILEVLEISGCPSLTSLFSSSSSSRGELPATLKRLRIRDCPKLESLGERFHSKNPSSLDLISIFSCESLKYLPENLHSLTRLSCLKIYWCPSLVRFPNRGLPAANFRVLHICGCEKLEALPNRMHELTSLQSLTIRNCPSIVSFFSQEEEEEEQEYGFPTSITVLEIEGSNICKAFFQCGLHRLSSLTCLNVTRGGCPDQVSFPAEAEVKISMVLPSSLIRLDIYDFQNLERLSSKGFRNLTSLENLRIWNCPKLQYFPENGLPPSLLKLHIGECTLLKERCKRDQGQEWSKITHVPCIQWEDDNTRIRFNVDSFQKFVQFWLADGEPADKKF